MNSLILETIIGLVFIFGVFSALVSVLTESVSRFVGLRGEYLLRGIRTLVDGKSKFDLSWWDMFFGEAGKPDPAEGEPTDPMVTKLLTNPIIASSGREASVPRFAGNAKLSRDQRRRLPSYVGSSSFASALLSFVVPDASGSTSWEDLRKGVNAIGSDPLKERLLPLVDQAEGDVGRLRKLIEEWYDDHMARVSGWYKQKVRWISLTLAAVVVLLFNLNTIAIARSLYTDEALRAAVVTTAAKEASCKGETPARCLSAVRKEILGTRGTGLPIGWGAAADCVAGNCGWLAERGLASARGGFWDDLGTLLLVLVGWSLMTLATVPGARFWFDALSRLGSLRSTGPKPERASGT